MPMSILRAGPSDVPLLLPLFEAYRSFYGQAPSPHTSSFLHQRLQQHESVVFIAFLNQQAVGFTQLYPSFSSVSLQRLWILNDLFVHTAARRQGVAHRLLQAAVAFAQQDGAKALQLETALNNTQAQALYQKAGWQRDSEFCVYHYLLEER